MSVRLPLLLAAIVAAAACGDDQLVDEEVAATSGTRLKVERYRYDDGTEQAGTAELYDADVHSKCTARPWSDGVVRCVPIADVALYTDAACSTLLGVAQTIAAPTHFLAYNQLGTQSLPDRLFEVGDVVGSPAAYFEKQGDQCLGPFPPPNAVYFSLANEIDGTTLVEVRDGETGDGRLGIRLREADDGLRLPIGLHDHALDVDCQPALQPDGTTACAPLAPTFTAEFSDPACQRAAVVVANGGQVPVAASVVDPSGCTGYRAIGAPIVGLHYHLEGNACVASAQFPGEQVFAADAPLAMPVLGRTLEAIPGRRLERILLDDGGTPALRFADDRLFDTAIRGACARFAFDPVTRCIPADVASGFTLFAGGCDFAVPVVELPAHTCTRLAFAVATTDAGLEIRAIGDPITTPLFRPGNGACVLYQPAADAVVHALGPPIDPQAFEGALYFGER